MEWMQYMFFRNKRSILAVLASAILVCGACGAETAGTIEPGASETTLSVVYPASGAALRIDTDLPGMLRLVGAGGSDFVSGTVQYSNSSWQPSVKTNAGSVDMVQSGRITSTASPDFQNLWKLRVGDSQPFSLNIHNGQAEGHWNFSGLPITSLHAELGAAKNAFTFDEPNPTTMQSCELRCGKGEVVVESIPYASCRSMVVEAGEGSLTLRFGSKQMLQGMTIAVRCGSGPVSIALAPQIPARVTVSGNGQPGRTTWGDGLQKTAGTVTTASYQTASYQTSSYSGAQGKTVEIEVTGGTGTVSLSVLSMQ